MIDMNMSELEAMAKDRGVPVFIVLDEIVGGFVEIDLMIHQKEDNEKY